MKLFIRFLLWNGAYRARTYDPLLVRQMLSQLSSDPISSCELLLTCDFDSITDKRKNVNTFFNFFLHFYFSAFQLPAGRFPRPAYSLSRRRRKPPCTEVMLPRTRMVWFFLPLFHHSFFQSMRTRDTKKATELKNQVSGYAQEMVWNTGTIWMAMET